MLKHYIRIAVRNLVRQKNSSILNMTGLSVGLSCFILISLYVGFELNYDKFQSQSENIYRIQVNRYEKENLESWDAYTFPALGPISQAEIPGIKDYFRLTPWAESQTVIYDGAESTPPSIFKEEKAVFADPGFLKYFPENMVVSGNDSLLYQPNRVVISQSIARKYFGEFGLNPEKILGKVLQVYNSNRDEKTLFTVEGIFKDIPQNSHLEYNIIFSHTTLSNFLPRQMPEEQRLLMFENSRGPNAWYTYLVLEDKVDPNTVAQAITNLVGLKNPSEITSEKYILQPIGDIHLHSRSKNEPTPTGNANLIYIMLLISVLILCIAWINYINISIARALDRLKEIGIRKITGARRGQILFQFLVEAFLLNAASLLIAIIAVQLSGPSINRLTGFTPNFFSKENGVLWLITGSIFMLGILFTGIYPYLALSRFQPASMLQSGVSSFTKGINLRKGLVVFQFSISVILLTGAIIIAHQTEYMRNRDTGIHTEHTIVIEGPNVLDRDLSFIQTAEIFKNEVSNHPSVKQLTVTSNIPGKFNGLTRTVHRTGQTTAPGKEIKEINIDAKYIPALGIEILAGRNFHTGPNANHNTVILNESAVTALGFDSPAKAIHQKIATASAGGAIPYEIIGVVRNFHQRSAKYNFEPLAFFCEIYDGHFMIQIESPTNSNLERTISFLKEKWNRIIPNNPFNYFFLDDYISDQYNRDQKLGQIIGLFSSIAILIACMGLFGLSAYTVSKRAKEIGIRKVLGASVTSVVALLSRDFIRLVLIAIVIATPIAWYAMNRWLQEFAYKIELKWWMFAGAGLVALAIAAVTISGQSIRAAMADPSKTLKTE